MTDTNEIFARARRELAKAGGMALSPDEADQAIQANFVWRTF